jgi:Rrf2 family transcriptional regulator, iron-sulfur cluster assembly transcription factor
MYTNPVDIVYIFVKIFFKMKVHTKIRYGLRAMLEFGLNESKKNFTGLHQKEIAQHQNLSEKYLDPIITSLKVSGLIMNAGGKKSGYLLARPKEEITIYDVYRAFEPELSIIHCQNKPITCFISRICVANEYWMDLNEVITNHMKSVTLNEIVLKHVRIKRTIQKDISTGHCSVK